MRKANIIFKTAMLDCIATALKTAGVSKLDFDVNSYSCTKDMVHFNLDKHNCILLGVEMPNLSAGTIILTMEAKGVELHNWENVRLNVSIKGFRCSTLEKIANEVYDYLKDTDWEEWEDFEKKILADWLDTLI